MSLHLGLHWNMILGAVKKRISLEPMGLARRGLQTAGAAVAAYGFYASMKNQIFQYLLPENRQNTPVSAGFPFLVLWLRGKTGRYNNIRFKGISC